MLIHAAARPRDTGSSERTHWTLEADDYGPAEREAIRAAVPAGWVLLYVRPERPAGTPDGVGTTEPADFLQ
ncbi:hypothetical protein G5V59_27420 [Nocardioides sp. W3-2-3]|uniref:hypothetical protein n=1 Tax=Nocardioides convexus TaxID=2712224 RepID=UPI002418B9E7|nr:hypothetical protein [Nocardioides convexus]NHA02113.1 hypothetical protein [Nocardioides convexus]